MEQERIKFEEYLRLEKCFRDETIKQYLYYYDKFDTDNLNKEYIKDFLLKKYHNEVSKAFVKRFLKFVRSNLEEYAELEYTDLSDKKLMPEHSKYKPRKLPKILTKNEVLTLKDGMGGERNKIMLLLTYYAGLRLAELIGINVHDFEWKIWEENQKKSGRLKVREEIAKGGNERMVYFPAVLMKRIYIFMRKNRLSGNLFNIKKSTWQKILTKESNRILKKHVHPHMLRHSFATHCAEEGMPVEQIQRLLGHVRISTTELYLHISQKKVEEGYEKVFG